MALIYKVFVMIISFISDKCLNAIWRKIVPPVEERAFSKAVKRWNSNLYVRGYYKQYRIKCIGEFCKYIKSHHGGYDNDIDSLYKLYEEELEKSTEGKLFLQDLRLKALNKDKYDVLMNTADQLNEQRKQHKMLEEIKQTIHSHNKGIIAVR